MGWASGSRMMDEIITRLHHRIRYDTDRRNVYTALIAVFEARDCDTLYECLGVDPVFDIAFQAAHPDWGHEEDEEEV